jgi:hypothetical protein
MTSQLPRSLPRRLGRLFIQFLVWFGRMTMPGAKPERIPFSPRADYERACRASYGAAGAFNLLLTVIVIASLIIVRVTGFQ